MFLNYKSKSKYQSKSLHDLREVLWNDFCSHEVHSWALEDRYLKKSLHEFFHFINPQTVEFLINKGPVYYLMLERKYASAISVDGQSHMVLIFSDLKRYLRSALPEYAYAILLHEIGHFIYAKNHTGITAQILADKLASEHGLTEELIGWLEEETPSKEINARLSALYDELCLKESS